eukprot:COSAG03_NODE_4842_length_1414_cov_1.399240_2_plen_29_part_01
MRLGQDEADGKELAAQHDLLSHKVEWEAA